MFKIIVYVPNTHIEEVKTALFDAGAGKIGDYDQCCWQIEGVGQFRPSNQANPHIGQANQLERVAETKLELVSSQSVVRRAVVAMLAAHPYEEPAYQVLSFLQLEDLPPSTQ